MIFLYTFPLTDYFAVISLRHGTPDELSSIFVMAYCHFMYQLLNFVIFTLANNFQQFNLFWTDEAHTPMNETHSRDVTRKLHHR